MVVQLWSGSTNCHQAANDVFCFDVFSRSNNMTSLLSQCRGPLLIPMVKPLCAFIQLKKKKKLIWNVHLVCLLRVSVCHDLHM